MRAVSTLSRRVRLSPNVREKFVVQGLALDVFIPLNLLGSFPDLGQVLKTVEPFRALSVFQGGDGRRSRPGSLRATWASAAALVGMGALATSCEAPLEAELEFKPEVCHGIKDPMTIYARQAIRRQTEGSARRATLPQQVDQERKDDSLAKEQPKQQQVNDKRVETEPTLQATSQKRQSQPSEAVQTTELVASVSAQATSPLDPALAPPQPPMMTAEEVRFEEKTLKAKQHSGGLKIFSGNGNMALALEIAKNLGINLGKATVGRFADGEVNVVIHENVRGKDVYVIQPTCTPVNDTLMELLLMVSTLRRASARRITVVIPYYGYARQDRKMQVQYNWLLRF
jgi:N-terminal domain of ribose phosphate pyrophosphokinase